MKTVGDEGRLQLWKRLGGRGHQRNQQTLRSKVPAGQMLLLLMEVEKETKLDTGTTWGRAWKRSINVLLFIDSREKLSRSPTSQPSLCKDQGSFSLHSCSQYCIKDTEWGMSLSPLPEQVGQWMITEVTVMELLKGNADGSPQAGEIQSSFSCTCFLYGLSVGSLLQPAHPTHIWSCSDSTIPLDANVGFAPGEGKARLS